ncbi:MAG: SOS response-associated peptidase [Candidatus Promineifilaceae bacterium]
MCGRFALFESGEKIAEAFGLNAADTAVLANHPLEPRYNIAPTQPVLAVRLSKEGRRELAVMQWGLVPAWSKDPQIGARMINARAETVAEKPSFRTAFKRRRCIIPASGFYEWQKTAGGKQPVFIHAADKSPLGLAGLWEIWQGGDGSYLESCTIITTSPNTLMRPIHNRMPVILEPEDYATWLRPDPDPMTGLHLLRPFPAEKMAAYPVSTYVNSPHNEGEACIAGAG